MVFLFRISLKKFSGQKKLYPLLCQADNEQMLVKSLPLLHARARQAVALAFSEGQS
jgi:hypothetical protein